jgi:electron transfer flavoprotein beta subunit
VVDKEKPDLVLMGKQAVDGDSNQVGQILAALLNWPQATFAATIDVPADEKSLVVTREVDAGVETKKVPLPAVVTVDLRIVGGKSVKNTKTPATHEYRPDPRLPSVKGVMGAKKKELKTLAFAELGGAAAPKVKTLSIEAPPPRKAGVKVADVNELVQKLAQEAKVI